MIWDHGITDGEDFIPLVSDDYIVTVTNTFGSSYDTIRVEVYPLPVSNMADQSVCPGEEVTLTATGGATYLWDQGVINGIPFVPEITTDYHVTITSDRGCIYTDTIHVTVHPLPTLAAGEDAEACYGDR